MLSFDITQVADILDYESLAINASTASPLTPSKLKPTNGVPAKYVMLTPSVASRFFLHGADPTSTVGFAIAAGDTRTFAGQGNLSRLRIISQGGAGTVDIAYGY